MRLLTARFEIDSKLELTKPYFSIVKNPTDMMLQFRPPKTLLFIVLTFFAVQLSGQNTKNSKNPQPVYRYALKSI